MPTAEPTPFPVPSVVPSETPTPSVEPSPEPTPEPSPEPSSIPLPPDEGETGGGTIETEKVEVGGNELDENDYTIGEDGTLTINPDFIATLPDGEHVITVTAVEGDVYESVIIVENGVPMSATPFELVDGVGRGGAWSLFDLIMTVVACVLAIIYLIVRPRKNRDDDNEYANKNTEEEETKHKKRLITSLVLLVLAVFSVILLFITQDFTQPMIVFDMWSIVFALVALVQVLIMFFIRKKNEDEDEQPNQRMTF